MTTHTTHTPRTPRGPSRARRSHAGRLAAAALGVASATGYGYALNHADTATPPAISTGTQVLPDSSVTPGAIDPNVSDADICLSDWKASPAGSPPVQGGSLTYSKAARHTSEAVKDQAFANYGIENPHDGGKTYEVDHLIPLSLGGRDLVQNLWPESRTASGYNAWTKDRLEFRLYNLMCHPQSGDPHITLAQAQEALRNDWTKAYETYCGNEDDCPAYSNGAGD